MNSESRHVEKYAGNDIELLDTHGVLHLRSFPFLFDIEDLPIIKSHIWYRDKDGYLLSLADNNSDYPKRAFAVLNNRGELIGYISYSVDNELRIAQWFGAINFSDDKLTFGRALRQVIEDCFLKFGMEVVEWYVICGNPIERSYD